MSAALLVTADGAAFPGVSKGAPGVRTGEVVFCTAMSGYQEVISDPSYAGQIVVMTAPHIGNYGVSPQDDQAPKPWSVGLVCRSLTERSWSWRGGGDLASYLTSHGIVAVSDVDTRRLTLHVRERGAMPAAIGTDIDEGELLELARAAPPMAGRDLAGMVSCNEPWVVPARDRARGRVAALDLGIKADILAHLSARGFDVHVLPANSDAEAVRATESSGLFVSNGPGDPAPLAGPIALVRELLGKLPIFGICLGHQILGLAVGAQTYKLPFGHHGANHPVRELAGGRVEITAQNHGFAVDLGALAPSESMAPGPVLEAETEFGPIVATHLNLNDGTLEGFALREVPAFGVQYHPEAAPGPRDAFGHFDRFAALMVT